MALRRLPKFVIALLLFGGCTPQATSSGGVSQLIEIRDGHRSVWGIEITLHDSRFPATLPADQLHVTEEKHDRDITTAMAWSVSGDRCRLTIRFKPEMGDFGTGNAVTVSVARAALANYSGANELQWTISTDPF